MKHGPRRTWIDLRVTGAAREEDGWMVDDLWKGDAF